MAAWCGAWLLGLLQRGLTGRLGCARHSGLHVFTDFFNEQWNLLEFSDFLLSWDL